MKKIKTALVSVYHKDGLDEIITLLHNDGVKFLSTGGSDYPIEELKIAGIDLTKPDTVKNALSVFADTLDELEALLAEL